MVEGGTHLCRGVGGCRSDDYCISKVSLVSGRGLMIVSHQLKIDFETSSSDMGYRIGWRGAALKRYDPAGARSSFKRHDGQADCRQRRNPYASDQKLQPRVKGVVTRPRHYASRAAGDEMEGREQHDEGDFHVKP